MSFRPIPDGGLFARLFVAILSFQGTRILGSVPASGVGAAGKWPAGAIVQSLALSHAGRPGRDAAAFIATAFA
jgi:hypothetical protein